MEVVLKEKPGEPTVDGTTFVRVVLSGENDTDARSPFDKNRLYLLDLLVKLYTYTQSCGEHFKKTDGRYEVNVPWVAGPQLADTNEMQSRERLKRVRGRLSQNLKLEEEYGKMEATQKESSVTDKATYHLTGLRFVLCATQTSDQAENMQLHQNSGWCSMQPPKLTIM